MATNRQIKLPGGGDTSYTNLTPMPAAFGGWDSGSTFNAMPITEVLDGLLYPYQVPSFGSFSISGQVVTLECGENVNGTNRTFVWTTANPANIKPNSIEIKDVTNNTVLDSGLANTGSKLLTFGNVNKTTTGATHQWRIQAQNTKDDYFQYNYYIRWYDPFYYGVGAKSLTVAQVQQLTKQVAAKANKTFSFSPSSQVYYFAYPMSYGALTSITDPNGFEIISDFTQRTVSFTTNGSYFKNIVAVGYYIYEFNNLTTQSNFNITFKF